MKKIKLKSTWSKHTIQDLKCDVTDESQKELTENLTKEINKNILQKIKELGVQEIELNIINRLTK